MILRIIGKREFKRSHLIKISVEESKLSYNNRIPIKFNLIRFEVKNSKWKSISINIQQKVELPIKFIFRSYVALRWS